MKVYFEAGANDGFNQSRTYKHKDDPEWIGILVEPDERCMENLIKCRHNDRTHIFKCALVPNDMIKLVPICQHSTPLMNTVADCDRAKEEFGGLETFSVEGRTIQSILNELRIRTVDEMYIDVEGYETEVLQGIDSETDIRFLEVECHYHNKSRRDKELNDINEQARRLGIPFHRINTEEGHPKLEFKKQDTTFDI